MKAQHEGALTPPFIIQKNPQVTNTVQQVVCHPVNNSRGKWSSIPPHKTRPDFLYQLCRETAIRVSTGARKPRRGNMRFLPPLEMRLSSIAPNPVESREAPPNSTVPLTSQRHPEKLHEVTGTCRGNPGFPATMGKDLESPTSTCLEARICFHGSIEMTRTLSPHTWRPDFPGATREAP